MNVQFIEQRVSKMQTIFRGTHPAFFVLAVTCLIGSESGAGLAFAQNTANTGNQKSVAAKQLDSKPPSALEVGPMQKVAKSVEPILKFKFSTETRRMELDRQSWNQSDGEDDRMKAIRKQLLDRGIDKERVEQLLSQSRSRSASNRKVINLFSTLRSDGKMRSYSSSSSSGFSRLTAGSAEIDCSLGYSDKAFEMKILETAGPMRSLDVVSRSGVRILLTSDNSIAMLQQTKTGIMGLLVRDEAVQSGKAKDYYEFEQEHPDLHAQLAARFRHAGVNLPLGINEPEVQQAALKLLLALNSNEDKDLANLLAGLDAPEFDQREAAAKAIALVFEQYERAIKKKLVSDELSIEVERRLRKLVNDNKSKRKSDTRAEDCVEANKLISSPEYLITLLDVANKSQLDLLQKRLKELTGEDLGNDPEAWRKWAVKNAQ